MVSINDLGWEPNNIYQDQEKKYQWHCRGENCPYCDAMEGRVYSLDVLMTSGVYPGWHKGCNCYVTEVPQYTLMSDLDIFGSALNMRNNSWLNALFGLWENLWVPGYITNADNIFANAKAGMTAGEALKIFNQSVNYGMFKDYGFPGNVFYPWNTNRNVNNWTPAIDVVKDIFTGLRQLISGEYLPTVITGGGSGLFLEPAQFIVPEPVQTYHNTYDRGWGR